MNKGIEIARGKTKVLYEYPGQPDQLVVAQTGASPSDAQARVDNAVTKVQQAKLQAQQAADTARKAARAAAIFTGLAMLIGAFIASISAALGGRLRDLHP